MRRLVLLVLVLILTTQTTNVFAHSETPLGTPPAETKEPLPDDGRKIEPGVDSVEGPLETPMHTTCIAHDASTEERTSASQPSADAECPQNFSPTPHSHRVTAVRPSYAYERSQTMNVFCQGPCTLERTFSMTWSHNWSASIGFDKAPVSAAVGYNVTYSATGQWSVSYSAGPGQTLGIGYRDYYTVTPMDVETLYVPVSGSARVEKGKAWAWQYHRRVFYPIVY